MATLQFLEPGAHAALGAQLGVAPGEFPLPLYVVEPQGRVLYCNDALVRLLGKDSAEILGKPSLLLYSAEATPTVLMARMHALVGGGSSQKTKTEMRLRDGGRVAVEVSARALEHDNRMVGLVIIARPMAPDRARPNVEYLLRLTPEQADALPYGLIVLDRSGVVIGYNATESRFSRIEKRRVVGRNFFAEIAPCTGVQDFAGLYQQMVETGAPANAQFDYVFRFRHGDRAVSITMAYVRQLEQGIVLVDPKPR